MIEQILAQIQNPSLSSAVVFIVIFFLTLMSEDLTCIAVGVLIGRGLIEWWHGILMCGLAIYAGDLLLFGCGRLAGEQIVRRVPIKWMLKQSDLIRAEEWFRHHGFKVVFISRFIPGIRLPTFMAAGVLRMPIVSFMMYAFLAVIIWTPLILWVSYQFHEHVLEYWNFFGHHSWQVILIAVVCIWLLFEAVIPLFSFRGRRLLYGKIQCVIRWEFWPAWFFYIPVIGHVLMLMIRYRSCTLFTAANPGIVAGGFIAESKFEILKGIDDFGGSVPWTVLIRGQDALEEKQRLAAALIKERGLNYPLILKPDWGQRGSGVRLIHNDRELNDQLSLSSENLLLQQYVPGVEYGVFFYRFPDQESGRIFAITEKKTPFVTGDGKKTLERLILEHDRAVCMAPFFFQRHAHHLWDVLPAGEKFDLTYLGTHCRGSVFYDGIRHKTPELEAEINRISGKFKGFYVGRYDIRVSSEEDFRRGRNLRVIELNGVTSEATSIYDPAHSVFAAYRVLFRQWDLVFSIAAQNRARGVKVCSLRDLLKLYAAYNEAASARND